MDKLRAIEYFNRSVEAGSFSAAARALAVSTPAVAKLVSALERSLGTTLVHRTNRGLALSAEGERFYATSRRLSADLRDLEAQFGGRSAKPRGTLTVGMNPAIAQYCVLPRIGSFILRYPDVELIMKPLVSIDAFEQVNADVAVLAGWPLEREWVVRQLAQTRAIICASPEYWAQHGRPQVPEDLREHRCLVFRSTGGTVLDRWEFDRDGERRSIDVRSPLITHDRSWINEAAYAGVGVARVSDLTIGHDLATGRLVPVLTDWEGVDPPRFFAAWRTADRNAKLIRVFVDFLVEVFARLDADRTPKVVGSIGRVPQPDWYARVQGRHSAQGARRRGK